MLGHLEVFLLTREQWRWGIYVFALVGDVGLVWFAWRITHPRR